MNSSQIYTYPSNIPFNTEGLTTAQCDAAIVQIARRIVAPVLQERLYDRLARQARAVRTLYEAQTLTVRMRGGKFAADRVGCIQALILAAQDNLYDPALGFDYDAADAARFEAAKIEREVRG